jgi:hypothetical protein
MIERQTSEKLGSSLKFWGKVMGQGGDYLIAYSISESFAFPTKKFYYCTGENFTLKQLPPADK